MGRGKGPKRRKTTSSSESPQRLAQGAGSTKRTQNNPFDPHGNNEIFFQVRAIKAERKAAGKPQWLIGWEGFGDSADTWEPIEHLAGYEQEIAAFRAAQEKENHEVDAANARRKRKAAANAEASSGEPTDADGEYPVALAHCTACILFVFLSLSNFVDSPRTSCHRTV